MKKIIILDHNGGRLGNQLWNFISIYAYCLEKKYKCINYSFYNYHKFFNIKNNNIIYKLFLLINNLFFLYKKRGLVNKLYRSYIKFIEKNDNKKIINSKKNTENNQPFYLPPTEITNEGNKKTIIKIEKENYQKIYFKGWFFRNPTGIFKYREQIIKQFEPKQNIIKKAKKLIYPLKEQYKNIIGVHIRQSDYKKFEGGKHYLNQTKIRIILEDYLKYFQIENNKAIFLICSDEKVNKLNFGKLNVKINTGTAVEDLYLLSLTDTIIGSNSTFGAFASYYGNIPFIIFDKKHINWEYYKDKKEYFNNPKCSVVHY